MYILCMAEIDRYTVASAIAVTGSVFMQRFRFFVGTVQTNWNSVNVLLLFWAQKPNTCWPILICELSLFFPYISKFIHCRSNNCPRPGDEVEESEETVGVVDLSELVGGECGQHAVPPPPLPPPLSPHRHHPGEEESQEKVRGGNNSKDTPLRD